MPIEAPTDVSAFDRALAWFRARVPVGARAYRRMEDGWKRRAFRVAGVEQLRLARYVFDSLSRAMADGEAFEEWKRSMDSTLGAVLERKLGSEDAVEARMELIFRNNLQTALNAGRWAELNEPELLKARPWWELVVVQDERTTKEICAKLVGVVVRAGAGWWRTHWPPLHHGCRVGVRSLRDAVGRSRSGAETGPDVSPAEGWGRAPGQGEWVPNVDDVPGPLRRAYRAKMKA